MWQIVVDHTRHTGDIQTTRGNVGGNQDFKLSGFKGLEGFHTISLCFVTMYRLGTHAVELKLTGQTTGTDFGI